MDNSPDGYRDRIDRFLNIASNHHIRPIFVSSMTAGTVILPWQAAAPEARSA